jgi:hypothetical protein
LEFKNKNKKMSYLLSPVEPDDEDFFKDVGKKWKERNDRQLR